MLLLSFHIEGQFLVDREDCVVEDRILAHDRVTGSQSLLMLAHGVGRFVARCFDRRLAQSKLRVADCRQPQREHSLSRGWHRSEVVVVLRLQEN